MVDLFSLAEAKQLGYIGGKDKKSLPVHIPEYSIEVLKFQNAAKAFETATKKKATFYCRAAVQFCFK